MRSSSFSGLRKEKSLQFLFLWIFLTFTLGCQSLKISGREDYKRPSFWVFKASIYSARKQKSFSGYVHMAYMSKNKIRIDLYGPLGLVHAGTFVYKKDKFQAFLPLERKFLFGLVHRSALQHILRVPIEPQILTPILFQQPITQKNWSCSFDEKKDLVKECFNENLDLRILWETSKKAQRKILILSPEGRVQLKLKKSKYIRPLADEKFDLKAPESYTKFYFDQWGIKKVE